jgi:hypothetical protein
MLPLIALFALVGCDNKDNSRPAAAMPVRNTPVNPASPPSSDEEKIKRIQAAPIPQKEKDAAIARVRSGKL